MIKLERVNSSHPDFGKLIVELDQDLVNRYGEEQEKFNGFNKINALETVVLAYVNDTASGCGCFKRFDDSAMELKRMFVAGEQRGQGIASSIIRELEQWAVELGYSRAVLETGNLQHEAIALYTKLGYEVIENFEPYTQIAESICMAKPLE